MGRNQEQQQQQQQQQYHLLPPALSPAATISAVESAASILAAEQESTSAQAEKIQKMVQTKLEERRRNNQAASSSSSSSSSSRRGRPRKPHDIDNTKRTSKARPHPSPQHDKSSSSLSSSSRSYLVLFELATEAAAAEMVQCLNGQPYTCLDETQVCHIQHVLALQGQDGVSLMSPFFAASPPPSTTATTTSAALLELTKSESSASAASASSSSSHVMEGGSSVTMTTSTAPAEVYNCAVCLEHMDWDHRHRSAAGAAATTASTTTDSNTILTTVCNHTFHMDCLLKWQDSPCPVCRYDHSGLNETLSRCHVCDTTENNFVCLICGIVSCGGGGGRRPTAAAVASLTNHNHDDDDDQFSRSLEKPTAVSSSSSSSLPAMSTGQQQQPLSSSQQRMLVSSHARQHYDQTLHAYALDTESQHVWDFAGQGYVHRLLQNKEDGKLVEVADPNNTTSQERSLSPGLSDAQEGEVVHRKLEGFASQYYTLLKSQLEQQRIYYQGRLEEIRREYESSHKPPSRRTCDWIAALKQERHQLSQRLDSLQHRCQKVSTDVSFLKSMNESLEANKEPLQKQLELARRERMETKLMFQDCLPALQEKVDQLMLQLELHTDQSDHEMDKAAAPAAAAKKQPATQRK